MAKFLLLAPLVICSLIVPSFGQAMEPGIPQQCKVLAKMCKANGYKKIMADCIVPLTKGKNVSGIAPPSHILEGCKKVLKK